MAYKFDGQLVPNVLLDQAFQATGIYIGQDGALHYAVIDPRRHTINVWTRLMPVHGYEGTARILGSHYFTNGPQMEPPLGTGKIATFFGLVLPIYNRFWRPYGRVISGGRVLHPGVWNTKDHFGRTGRGHFSDYVIAPDPAAGQEAIGGLVRLVNAGAVVTSPDTITLGAAVGICAWGLCPLSPVPTDGWLTELPWIDPNESDELDGLIIVAGSDQQGFNPNMGAMLLAVGVKDAVATDGSDSVIMGSGTTFYVRCALVKDGIQRWGFACF